MSNSPSPSSSTPTKMITLTSSDDQTFTVEAHILSESQTIKNMMEDSCIEYGVPVDVRGEILAKILEYCQKHADVEDPKGKGKRTQESAAKSAEELKEWDAEFVKIDRSVIFELIKASMYLNIESLLELTCQTVADEIQDLPIPQIREILNIKNDFTPEEEEELLEELAWAFDE